MVIPNRLLPGDTVGVIAPASPPDLKNLQQAIIFLEELGLRVKVGESVDLVHGYLAGKDTDRLDDIHQMFSDQDIKAVICAGGGYGTARIAGLIDYEVIRKNPKIFWGYSDITYLHTAIRQETGLVTFHGPMLSSDIGKESCHALSKQSFLQLFYPKDLHYSSRLSELAVISEGVASGELVGGNLSLLISSLGTPFELKTKGKLLLLEDIDEAPYRIDSMLNQLKAAGKLEEAAGVVVGDFHNAVPANNKPSLELSEVLDHYLKGVNKPVIKGFKIGHCQPHFAVPLGVHAKLSTTAMALTIQSGVN
ncbi:S66 peptidase family protein [Thalassobacillus pellis]|uniref:S66 peptidase family protein n=1 Tax=Thalassobacillus pellis TaxID=748008 RepID=UPI001960AB63|nr:LD-carboxypeptidase [Thalassobacillus pellis]MBM7552792.1 muramoyltetrapeptide carboxypeptidase [Thalassobacillus pellis]